MAFAMLARNTFGVFSGSALGISGPNSKCLWLSKPREWMEPSILTICLRMVPLSIWNPHLRLFEDRTFNRPIVESDQAVEKFSKVICFARQSPDEFDNSNGITRKLL
jgi:hypothetical protein